MRKKLGAMILSTAMVLSMTACSSDETTTTAVGTEKAETTEKTEATQPVKDQETTEGDTVSPETTSQDGGVVIEKSEMTYRMRVNSTNGEMQIDRLSVENGVEADEGTWTIFVYLCGSDLESENGMGTADIEEMLNASGSEDVKFVVYTGGASAWQDDMIDAETNSMLVISNGEKEVVYQNDASLDMGLASTLEEFLTIGIENYPAQKMGLVLWNHGSGSINGVCFDELNDDNSLSLDEIDEALLNTRNKYSSGFEFIGFDACLMGTIEAANVLANHAKYMYGSEETEPGNGWNYTAIGDFLAENTDADGAELGKVVCDSFYEACKAIDQHDKATLTVFNLSEINDFLVANNNFFYNLYSAISEDSTVLSSAVRGIYSADNFGGNNKTEGYTNMVDLGNIISNLSGYAAGGDEAIGAMKKLVAYNINGSTHAGATGISTYYPLEIQGSDELKKFSDMCVSPYYLTIVDMIQKSQYLGTDFSDYSNDDMFGADGWEQGSNTDNSDYFSYIDENEGATVSDTITFEQEPVLDEESGTFYFILDDDGYNNAMNVSAIVCQDLGDDVIELGETVDVIADWETGTFQDNFDGYWVSLPDGQNLALYIAATTEEYIVYTSPIRLNGTDTNLRFVQYFEDMSIEIDGIWAGIGENGYAARDVYGLSDGDVIIPLYHIKDGDGVYTGSEYVFDSDDELGYAPMYEGRYYYYFSITDIYGNATYTSYVVYAVDEDGGVIFYIE